MCLDATNSIAALSQYEDGTSENASASPAGNRTATNKVAATSQAPRLLFVPELPEVQALAEKLDARFAGASLLRAEALSFSSLKTFSPSPDDLTGKRLSSVGRRGKFLVFDFERLSVLVHLSQGGRIVVETGKISPRPQGGVVRLRFEGRAPILVKEFGSERKAGWWVLPAGDQGPLEKLGPEPFSEGFLAMVSTGRDAGRLHTMLRDQRRVAGIGRGYADDILHRAMLSPFRSLASLDSSERSRLLSASRSVLEEALERERSRGEDFPIKLGDRFTVHGRAGRPCPACGSDLRLVSYESHEVTYCPACQTGGKVLADRRLSRIVR